MEKKYNAKDSESAIQKLWQDEQTFRFQKTDKKEDIFSIDTPPPTVSGALHIGHIFSYTHADIIARFQRLNGKSVFYPFGFDDNGLPTEKYIEKKCKVSAHKLGRSGFIDLCLKETKDVEKQFQELWQQIGLSVDWDKKYETISKDVRKISQESFIRLLEKGYVYRKYEPALYCTACRTSVAQAELDDVEKPSVFYTLTFDHEDGTPLPIATTRPELLSSCVAILYHPDDKRYNNLKGLVTVPLFNNKVSLIADELVQPDKGTGLVMCCTFGDNNDILWYKKYNLDYKESIGLDGKWVESTGFLAGLKAPDARKAVVEKLKSENKITDEKPIVHMVNTHERCKKDIEFAMLSQWFLSVLPYKEKFLELAETIDWHPQYMKSRFINWVENISWDWCLSRQRFYGIPFPVWHCNDCNEVIVASIDQLPIDPQEEKLETCSKCDSTNIVPDTDVMDTWNTSSLTPQICYKLFNPDAQSVFEKESLETFIPMSMRPQAHDIIRTWAFYTIVKSWMHLDSIPWKEVVISGHVLSGSKEKLSKSKGNASLTPENLLERWSADAIRYWTASGSLGTDVAYSENQLKIGNKLVTKLWNAFFFVHDHTKDVDLSQQPQELGTVNEWILSGSSECFSVYKKSFDNYEYSAALIKIEQFFWNDFCDNYLEIIKDQLFNPDSYTQEQLNATKWTLYSVGLRIIQMYAPFIPFVTEGLYQENYKNSVKASSLHTTSFDMVQKSFSSPKSKEQMASILEVISLVRKLKSENQLSLKTQIQELSIISQPDIAELLKKEEAVIKGVTKSQSIIFEDTGEPGITHNNDEWKAIIRI